jgi:hypothetical protein
MRVRHSIMRTSEQPGPLESASASLMCKLGGRAGQSDWQPGAHFRHRRGVDSESESLGGSETASALAMAQVKVSDLE